MNDWDQMIARQTEQDGIRMASGQHITDPADGVPCPAMPWADRAAEIQAEAATRVEWRDGTDPWQDRRDDDR